MPKMKTKSGVKKRFKITGSGKVVFQRVGKRHRNMSLSPKRIRQLRGTTSLKDQDARVIKKFAPYGLS